MATVVVQQVLGSGSDVGDGFKHRFVAVLKVFKTHRATVVAEPVERAHALFIIYAACAAVAVSVMTRRVMTAAAAPSAALKIAIWRQTICLSATLQQEWPHYGAPH